MMVRKIEVIGRNYESGIAYNTFRVVQNTS